jgi:hypothetical protein
LPRPGLTFLRSRAGRPENRRSTEAGRRRVCGSIASARNNPQTAAPVCWPMPADGTGAVFPTASWLHHPKLRWRADASTPHGDRQFRSD